MTVGRHRAGQGRADYSRLTAALLARAEPVVTLLWSELDGIVGGLPRSAVDHYPQWWHGDRPNTKAWRAAGFELVAIELNRWVKFRRTDPGSLSDLPARTTSSAPFTSVPMDALSSIEPREALLVLPCSATKLRGGQPPESSAAAWPRVLLQAREDVLRNAALDDSRMLPAWRRYAGRLYRYADEALAEAVAAGHVVIISGGYGLVRADELIGSYDKVLSLCDWSRGLLETLLADEACRTPARTVVAFASASQNYARLVRQVRWRDAGVTALLVTITGVAGGAMVEVPRRLGQAFTAFWHQRHDQYPAGTTVEALA